MQKLLIVNKIRDQTGTVEDNMQEVNDLLNSGWTLKSMNPMGASAYGIGAMGGQRDGHLYGVGMAFASLVLLEK
ncbi:MAG: hypothetical protein Ta2B_16550 [Termitinemataceae bacterium]|nr:MAG: hypothetical protein Ta2B_16550 [Termitinemataceae bacterium]